MKGGTALLLGLLAALAVSACGAHVIRGGDGPSASTSIPAAATSNSPAPKPPGPVDAGVVPWIATAYDPKRPTPIPGTVADPSVRWCTSADIALSWAPGGPAGLSPWPGQAAGGWILAANRSKQACAVQGEPSAAVVGLDGRHLTFTQPADRFLLQWWVRLDPSSAAAFSVQWSEMCDAPDGPYTLAIAVPPVSDRPIALSAGSASACGAVVGAGNGYGSVQTSGLAPFAPNSPSPFGQTLPTPLNSLGFGLGPVQPTVHAGSVLAYRLTVLNSAINSPVSLSPCFGYRERLRDETTNNVAASEMHLLNCASRPILAPNSTTEFALEIAIPATLPSGTQLSLYWDSAFGAEAMGNPTVVVE